MKSIQKISFFLGYTHREYVLDTNDGYMKRPYVWYYEQNKQVFFKYDTGSFKLVYDFNITVGDTFYVPNYNAPTGTPWQTYTTVILDDSNSVDWPGRRMIEFANGGQWVEGMGLVNGFWVLSIHFLRVVFLVSLFLTVFSQILFHILVQMPMKLMLRRIIKCKPTYFPILLI